MHDLVLIFVCIDIPWIDNTHVSLTCEWGKDECIFQFWKDREEQFYCELTECSQSSKVQDIQKLNRSSLKKILCNSLRGE